MDCLVTMKQKVVVVVQARMNSSRLPGKISMVLYGKPLLIRVIERISIAQGVDDIVVATSQNPFDDVTEKMVYHYYQGKIHCFRGSETNVLERVYFAAMKYNADIVVRVTADNPLTEGSFIDELVDELIANELDYCAYHRDSIPLGSGVEVFTFDSLKNAYFNAESPYDKEHVTPYIINHAQKVKFKDAPKYRLSRTDIPVTVDELKDYVKLFSVYEYFKPAMASEISLEDALRFLGDIQQ